MPVDWHRRMRAAGNPAVATGWVAAAGMTAVMLLAACGGQGGQQPAAAPTPTALAAAPTPTASAAASASGASACMSQFTTWRDGGGDAKINDVANAVPEFMARAIDAGLAAPSDASVARLKTTAASLQGAVKTAQADPPPSCVPGLRAHHKAAMAGFEKGAQGALDAAKAARSGDTQTATSKINAATSKINAATEALDAMIKDMETFTASG